MRGEHGADKRNRKPLRAVACISSEVHLFNCSRNAYIFVTQPRAMAFIAMKSTTQNSAPHIQNLTVKRRHLTEHDARERLGKLALVLAVVNQHRLQTLLRLALGRHHVNRFAARLEFSALRFRQ